MLSVENLEFPSFGQNSNSKLKSMKRLLPCLIFSLLFFVTIQAQTLVSATFLGHKTKTELQLQYLFFTIKNGVNYYKITYTTPDVQGNSSVASALMAVPDDTTKVYPLLCYQHGTSSSKTDVPSYLNGESAIPIAFGGLGFLTVTPDYLGLGDSPGFHPYVHAATEASAGADALRAIQEYALNEGICFTNDVYLTGYSQGGHSSAALHRALDETDEFNVKAAAHLSGPYSISVVMRDLLFADEAYSRPAYLINTMFSYQYVYGNLYSDMTEAVKPAYVAKCNDYYNGVISLSQLNDYLVAELTAAEGAPIASRIFNDDFKAAVEADPNHPVNLALADNDVHDWVPTAPTRLFYCAADDQVPFENSLVAEAAFLANGSTTVTSGNLGNLSHVGCVTPALYNTVQLFAPIQGTLTACSQVSGVDEQELSFQVYPNPTSDVLYIRDFPGDATLRITDLQGRVVSSQAMLAGDNMVLTNGLHAGLYFLDFQGENGSVRKKITIVK